jgi:hypothetical protein
MSIDWESFFKRNGEYEVKTAFYGMSAEITVEELYQAFAARVKAEIGAGAAPETRPAHTAAHDCACKDCVAAETYSCIGNCGASVIGPNAYCSACLLRERRTAKETRPDPAERTVWTKTSDSDPYCIHCGKTWDMHLCDGRSSCPTANRGGSL